MSLPNKFGSMTSEEKIQYVFNTLNTNSEEYRSNVASLLMNDPSPIVRHEAAYIFGEIEESCKVRIFSSFCWWFPTFRDVVEES